MKSSKGLMGKMQGGIGFLCFGLSPFCLADDPPIPDWEGEAELGYVMTSGNSETDSLNVRLRLENRYQQWWHKLYINALHASDGDEEIAKNYSVLLRSEYFRTEGNYLFGSVRQDYDPFAGYDGRQTAVTGTGYRWDGERLHQIALEAGIGVRRTEYTSRTADTEGIFRLAMNYLWKISETSEFRETLSTEIGEENTYTESETSLKVKINSALAMKLNLTVKDNSKVLPETKHTDTKTSVTLAYDF